MIHLAVRKDASLGLKDQSKRQIRAATASRSLVRDERIPSSSDIAAMLRINRNTVALAYRDPTQEEGPETITASGTVISNRVPHAGTSGIPQIVRRMLEEAGALDSVKSRSSTSCSPQ